MPGSFFVADSFDKMPRVWAANACARSVGCMLRQYFTQKENAEPFPRNTKRWRIMPQC